MFATSEVEFTSIRKKCFYEEILVFVAEMKARDSLSLAKVYSCRALGKMTFLCFGALANACDAPVGGCRRCTRAVPVFAGGTASNHAVRPS